MNKIVLAYNFSAERLQALRLVCMLVKAQLRPVSRAAMLQPLGFLAGVPGVSPVEEAYSGDEANEEMLVLCGFSRPELDRLLAAIRKGKLQKVELKAMLTQHNVNWSGVALLKEISEEHQYMTSGAKKTVHEENKPAE